MHRKRRWSLKATLVTTSVVFLGVGTVAAQSVDVPWWVDSGLVYVADGVTVDGSVVISEDGFSGSLAKAKANYPETGEYIGCNVTAIPGNGQFIRCAARDAAGETSFCQSVYIGSELDFRKATALNVAMSINADSYIYVEHGGTSGDECQLVEVSNTSADFLAFEGGGTGGVEDCTLGNSTNLGAFGGAPVSVSNDACLVVTQFANPQFNYGPNRTMQLQNSGGSTSYPLSYEYSQTCTGAAGSGNFDHGWDDQYLPGLDDDCPLFIKLQGNGAATVSLNYY